VLPSAAAGVLRPDQVIFMYPQLGETWLVYFEFIYSVNFA